MSNEDILATFKKHLGDIEIDIAKNKIHNFGEHMKGINEFIGAAQILQANLTKIKNLAEKIQWLDDLITQESNQTTAQMLEAQKNAHIGNIKFILDGSTFMGIKLFDTQLSCVIGGEPFGINIENPLHYLNNNILGFCIDKIEYLNDILVSVSDKLNGKEDSSSVAKYDDFSKNMLLHRI